MSRIRSIKPEFARSSSTAQLSRDARLLFLLLLPECDDAGRVLGSSKMLAGILFPHDRDVGERKLEKWLHECETAEMVTLYEVAGTRYLQVTNFSKHQKVSHPYPSVLPPPPEPLRNGSGISLEPVGPDMELDMDMEKEMETDLLPAVAGGRKPNALWDALVELLGYSPTTKSETGNWGRVTKELRDAGATPDEVYAFAGHWRRTFPGATLTVNSVTKWWSMVKAHPMNGSGSAPPAWDAIANWLERQK